MDHLNYVAPRTVGGFMQSDARRRVIMGPFGSGKSSGCVIEIVRRSMMQKRGSDGYRRSRWAIVRNTMPQLRDTTMKTWFEWFPDGSIGYWKETGKTYFIIKGDVRAEVMFRALDDEADVKNLLSLELTGAWVNECREIPAIIIDGIDGRINRYPSRRGG
jgi:phage terminase large subunit